MEAAVLKGLSDILYLTDGPTNQLSKSPAFQDLHTLTRGKRCILPMLKAVAERSKIIIDYWKMKNCMCSRWFMSATPTNKKHIRNWSICYMQNVRNINMTFRKTKKIYRLDISQHISDIYYVLLTMNYVHVECMLAYMSHIKGDQNFIITHISLLAGSKICLPVTYLLLHSSPYQPQLTLSCRPWNLTANTTNFIFGVGALEDLFWNVSDSTRPTVCLFGCLSG